MGCVAPVNSFCCGRRLQSDQFFFAVLKARSCPVLAPATAVLHTAVHVIATAFTWTGIHRIIKQRRCICRTSLGVVIHLSAPVSSVHQLDHRRVLVFWLRFGEKIFIKLLQHYKLNFHLIQWLNGSPVKVRKRITLQHVANADQEVRHDRGRMSNGWIFRFIECHWRDLTASRILQILQSFTLKMFPRRYFQRSGD